MKTMKTIGAIIIAGLVLPAASAFAAETYDSRVLHLKNVTGTVHIRTADVSKISVDVDNGAGVIDDLVVSMDHGVVVVSGRKYRRMNCNRRNDKVTLSVARFGIGKKHPLTDFPTVTVTMPKDASLDVSGGRVFGEAGDLGEADIQVNGCGNFSIGNVSGDLEARVNGSGDFTSGDVGGALEAQINGSGDLGVGNVAHSAEVQINGSGDLQVGAVAAGVEAQINGSGDIDVVSVHGEVDADINGSGDIQIHAGTATPFSARITGSGDVAFQGHANGVHARVIGSGDITLASYDGEFNASKRGVHVEHR